MRRTVLIAAFLLAIAGCGAAPFRETELVGMEATDPAGVLDRFQASLPGRFRTMSSLVFEFARNKVSALGITEVDRGKGTFTAMAMNPLGVKLFEISGDREQIVSRYVIEPMAQRGNAADAIGEDIRRIYFGLVPSPDASVHQERRRLVFRERSGPGTIEYVFGGADGFIIEKRYTEDDRTVWRVRYYEYRRANGKAHPQGIVLDNARHGYRLIVKVKEITT
jgi:hypothetical protein